MQGRRVTGDRGRPDRPRDGDLRPDRRGRGDADGSRPRSAALAAAATGLDRSLVAGIAGGAVLAASDGDGFDVVFDATGNRASMQASFGHVAHGGTLVFVGVLQDTSPSRMPTSTSAR